MGNFTLLSVQSGIDLYIWEEIIKSCVNGGWKCRDKKRVFGILEKIKSDDDMKASLTLVLMGYVQTSESLLTVRVENDIHILTNLWGKTYLVKSITIIVESYTTLAESFGIITFVKSFWIIIGSFVTPWAFRFILLLI